MKLFCFTVATHSNPAVGETSRVVWVTLFPCINAECLWCHLLHSHYLPFSLPRTDGWNLFLEERTSHNPCGAFIGVCFQVRLSISCNSRFFGITCNMIIKAILQKTTSDAIPMRHEDGLFHFTYSVWRILTNFLLFINVFLWGQLVRPDYDQEKASNQPNHRMLSFMFSLYIHVSPTI